MTDKISKNIFQHLSLRHMILMIVLASSAFVIFDQCAYADKLKEWYRIQRLQADLNCQGNSKWLRSSAKNLIKQNHYNDPISNISLAYVSPSGRQSSCNAGWVNQIGESPTVTSDTVYQFASVTKVFTADIVLQLVREGRLDLNDKLINLLPELRDVSFEDNRIRSIEVRHLLSHTAGFDRSETGVLDDIFQPKPWCPEHVKRLKTIELQFAPNERMAYSNIGYCLLSRIVEEVYQQPYRDIVRQRYQLKHYDNFDFIGDNGEIPTTNSAIKPLVEPLNYKSLAAAAGLYGSATDLAALIYDMERTEHPNIIDRASDSQCDTTAVWGCHGYMGYEYGADPSLRFYWRSGDMNNVSALIIIDDKGGVMSMLTNARIRARGINQLVNDIYEYRLSHEIQN